MKMGLRYVDTFDGEREFCLTISIAHLLDGLQDQERKELIGYAVASGELLKMICRQIAAGHEPKEQPAADIILDDRTISEMRQALMPLLSDAHAAEMKVARKMADDNFEAAETLRSLVHIDQLRNDAPRHSELYLSRCEQWSDRFARAKNMFPEYGKEPHESHR